MERKRSRFASMKVFIEVYIDNRSIFIIIYNWPPGIVQFSFYWIDSIIFSLHHKWGRLREEMCCCQRYKTFTSIAYARNNIKVHCSLKNVLSTPIYLSTVVNTRVKYLQHRFSLPLPSELFRACALIFYGGNGTAHF